MVLSILSILLIIGVSVLLFLTVIAVSCAFAWYRIVPPSEAHLVVTPKRTFVASPDPETGSQKTYFAIPSSIPFFGRSFRILDVTIKELIVQQGTIDKDQARYNVKSSTKYRITDVKTASERFISDEELKNQLKEVVNSSVRAITVKYDVVDARAKKQEMDSAIRKEMTDDLKAYGLELISFQLVDFQDTDDSDIISDISKRREVEIRSITREQNAEKVKQARMKEAESEEKAKEREIEKDRVIGEKEQLKEQKISEMRKTAEEKRFEVVSVQTIRQAEIDKEKAIVVAEQKKEAEEILKEQKQLEGEGDKLKAKEIALGNAEKIRQNGFAEAEAKDKLQEALNKFDDKAIRALVAEKIVAMQETVGVASAEALKTADLKIFAGGDSDGTGKAGFDLGKLVESISVANEGSAKAVLNKLARPNDLGFAGLSLLDQKKADVEKKPVKETTTKTTKQKAEKKPEEEKKN